MKTEAVGDLTVGQDYIFLPEDFIDPRDFWLTGFYQHRLQKGDERLTWARYSYGLNEERTKDIPFWYYISGDKARFDNVPDQAYHYLFAYYGRPEALSTANQSNWLTQTAPRLLRTACMLVAVEFEKESGQGQFDRTYWQEQFQGQLQDFQIMSDNADAPRDQYPVFA